MACFEITILKLRFEAKVNDTKSLLVSRESELKAFQLCIDKFSLVQVKLKSDSRIHTGYCAFLVGAFSLKEKSPTLTVSSFFFQLTISL